MDAIQLVSGTFSRRFFLNALLPTFVFVGITLLIITNYTLGLQQALRAWEDLPVSSQFVAVFTYLSLIYFISAAVASQWRSIVRIFEGYPIDQFLRRFTLETPGRRWHQDRRRELRNDPNSLWLAYYSYPKMGNTMATRLGNILLAGEQYSSDRYSMDGILFWPRLFPLLPETFKRDYEEFVINYEFPLVVAFEAAVATIISSTAVLVFQGSPLAFVLIGATGTLMSYAAYRLSLSSAMEVAEQQRTAFDLYRDRLFLAWPAVRDIKDEEAAFMAIQDFVILGEVLDDWDPRRNDFVNRTQEPAKQTLKINIQGPE